MVRTNEQIFLLRRTGHRANSSRVKGLMIAKKGAEDGSCFVDDV